MRSGFTYFLWNGTRPSYKHIKIWVVRVYIIDGCVTRENLDYISHSGYFMGYAATTGVIIYWNPDQPFFIHRAHNVWFDEYNYRISIEDKHTPSSFYFINILKFMFIIQTSSTLFHVNLILYPLHFVIQQLSHMKLSYIPLERNLVLIYWMMKTLQSHILLV